MRVARSSLRSSSGSRKSGSASRQMSNQSVHAQITSHRRRAYSESFFLAKHRDSNHLVNIRQLDALPLNIGQDRKVFIEKRAQVNRLSVCCCEFSLHHVENSCQATINCEVKRSRQGVTSKNPKSPSSHSSMSAVAAASGMLPRGPACIASPRFMLM